MKHALIILLTVFIFSCNSKSEKETTAEVRDSASVLIPPSPSPVAAPAPVLPAPPEDSVWTEKNEILGNIITDYGENCDQAIARTNARAVKFMRDHGKPCYKAATSCKYDTARKVYVARANVHNHQGSCD